MFKGGGKKEMCPDISLGWGRGENILNQGSGGGEELSFLSGQDGLASVVIIEPKRGGQERDCSLLAGRGEEEGGGEGGFN